MEVFDHRHLFTPVTCQLHGQVEEVSMTTLDLIWKPTGGLIRFVFAHTRLGLLVLMCSDLQQDPIEALQLYCTRVRVEVMFDVLKNLLVAFCYRFWSKHLPRHSRTPKSNETLQGPATPHVESARGRWRACEGFVMLGAIAQGFLQLLAVKFPETVWAHFDAFLRTRSRHLPFEIVVEKFVRVRCRGISRQPVQFDLRFASLEPRLHCLGFVSRMVIGKGVESTTSVRISSSCSGLRAQPAPRGRPWVLTAKASSPCSR
jgi:hypothetical protein